MSAATCAACMIAPFMGQCQRFSIRNELDIQHLEAEAIAAEKRALKRSYPVWRVKRHKMRATALAERERAFRETRKRRRATQAQEFEAAIQSINEGRWPEGKQGAARYYNKEPSGDASACLFAFSFGEFFHTYNSVRSAIDHKPKRARSGDSEFSYSSTGIRELQLARSLSCVYFIKYGKGAASTEEQIPRGPTTPLAAPQGSRVSSAVFPEPLAKAPAPARGFLFRARKQSFACC